MNALIFPSCDLHLYTGAGPIRPRIFVETPPGPTWLELSSKQNFQLALTTMQQPPVVTLNGNQITPAAEGSQLATLRAALGNQSWDLALRVSVHHQLKQLFFAVASLELETGRSDRVLTVYAQFVETDGTLATFDVTQHPYLAYAVDVTSGSSDVVQVDATGRVTTGNAAGSARITVSAAGAHASMTVNVTEPPADRPILDWHWRGSAVRKRNVLFVSEGFTTADKPRFDKLMLDLTLAIVNDTSPYELMRESFDVYSAFVPSPESGITIGPPVVGLTTPSGVAAFVPVPTELPLEQDGDVTIEALLEIVGSPWTHASTFATASAATNTPTRTLTQLAFGIWQSLAVLPPQTRIRETAFGLTMGVRHYGTGTQLHEVTATSPPVDPSLDLLLPLLPNRTPMFDERRLPDIVEGDVFGHGHIAAHDRFVRTLRAPDGPAGFGATWATGGDSFGLVIYVCNSDHYGGLYQFGYMGMSVGGGVFLQRVPSAIPGLFDVTPVKRPLDQQARNAGFVERPVGSITITLTHELGHTPAIGHLDDEYGSNSFPPQRLGASDFDRFDDRPNTQPLPQARNGTAIAADRLKWNWERVEAAATVEDLSGTGRQLTIVLDTEDIVRWPLDIVGRTVFLRVRVATLLSGVPASGPLVVRAFDLGAQTIQVDVPVDTSAEALITLFSAHGVVVLPRVDPANQALRLVDPNVIRAMQAGPFAATTNCVPVDKPAPPATIAGYTFPLDHNSVIAAYETAGQFDCDAIRPAAQCKMRQQGDAVTGMPNEFCFVCKYAIVETVDPGAHGDLDRNDYPRAPGTGPPHV